MDGKNPMMERRYVLLLEGNEGSSSSSPRYRNRNRNRRHVGITEAKLIQVREAFPLIRGSTE